MSIYNVPDEVYEASDQLIESQYDQLLVFLDKHKSEILREINNEHLFAKAPVVRVDVINDFLAELHTQCPENAYRWAVQISGEIADIYRKHNIEYFHGASNRSANNGQ